MFESIYRSIELAKESFEVIKKDNEILLFPILSGITCLIFVTLMIVPIFIAGTIFGESLNNPFILYGGLFVFYLVTSFIVVFFNTALVSCAHIRLTGGDPTFRDGISQALMHLKKIFAWAVISATVGVILSFLRDENNIIGQVVISMIGMAWGLLTYFVVPVMILEDLSIVASVKQSTSLFRKTWGESIVGPGSISLIFIIIGLVALLPLFLLLLFGNVSLIMAGFTIYIILIVVLAIIASALQGVFNTALYIYAKTGTVPSAFRSDLVTNAFVSKKSGIGPGNI